MTLEEDLGDWCETDLYEVPDGVGCEIDRDVLGMTLHERLEIGQDEIRGEVIRWNEDRVEFTLDRAAVRDWDVSPGVFEIETEENGYVQMWGN